MSRFPILSSAYLKFTLAGKPLKIFQGDYYVGKGCGSVCIDHPHIGLVDVFTTHVSFICINKAIQLFILRMYVYSCRQAMETMMNMKRKGSPSVGRLQMLFEPLLPKAGMSF